MCLCLGRLFQRFRYVFICNITVGIVIIFKEKASLSSRWRMFRLAGRPVFPGGPAGYSRESTPDGGAHYMESYRDVNGK